MSNLFGGTPLPGRFDKVEKADLTGVTQVATTMNVRDKEMARRFEKAEEMRRTDIDTAAGYDLSAIGQFGSEIFQQEVDEVSQLIASGQLDPTQAKVKLAGLKNLYGQFKTHAESMSDEDAVANKLATDPNARSARNSDLGVGEELSYGLDDYAAQHNTALNNVFKEGSAEKGPDGNWTVIDPTTGERVPFSQVTGFADPSHFYRYGTNAVDVGTLGNWAQDSATSSAIAFRDGSWNQGRAEEYYLDNVLVDNDNGKAHRLQLLGTLEDEGLITHFSDDDKKAFRDGSFITKEDPETGDLKVFQKIVDQQGNVSQGPEIKDFSVAVDEGKKRFLELSRFDGLYTNSGKRSSSEEGFSDKVVRGGYAVPVGQDVNVTNTGSGFGPSQPYNVNRLNSPITMNTGLATQSGTTRTTNADGTISTVAGPSDDGTYKIVGGGYSPDGRLMAMVSTEVTTMEPEFGYSDGEPQGQMVETSRTVNKPIYLTDLNGEPPTPGTQELEIYNTITQNPDLGPILRDDRARRSQSLLQDLSEQNPNAGTSVPQYVEGTDNATTDRNVEIAAEIQEGLPEDVRQEVNALQDRVLNEEGVGILPRVEGNNVVFFDRNGRRRNDLGTVVLRTQGPSQRGEDAPTPAPRRGQESPQQERGLQEGERELGETPEAEEPTRQEVREARNQGPGVEPTQPSPAQVIPTTEEEVEQRQDEGVVRDPSERQRDIAVANAPAAEEIINSEATTPTPESEELVVQEMQNSPMEIPAEELSEMSPVDLALRFIGTNEVENKDVVQEIMAEWIGESEAERLDVTTGNGAWCAAFVSKILSDTGHADTLDVVRGEDNYNLIRARRFESIGTPVDKSEGKVGDIIVIEGSAGPNSRHVGIFVGYDDNGNVKILGGNQANEVNVTAYDADRLISLRRPFEEDINSSQIANLSEVAVRDSTSGSTR